MKNEVVKPSNLIHIVHNLSLLQAQLWDFILAQTPSEEILTKDYHQLPISTIMKFLDNTRNSKHVKVLLEEMGTIFTYTLIKKDSSEDWGCFPLFSSASVVDNVFIYSYPAALKNAIANPSVYSCINLSMVRKFDRKYALFLYSLCFDYKNILQTPWLTLRQFCDYMGVKAERYADFSALNYHVVKKAVAEVNAKSDLVVRAIYQTTLRKTTDIKFAVLRKDGVKKASMKRFEHALKELA